MAERHNIVTLIDRAIETDQESGFRAHLGGSMIGRPCNRELWYSFRWATDKKHSGRMLRLFKRGHMEEPRIIEYLARVGITVQEVDPATGKQWRISDVDGHFGGSLDGVAVNVPGFDPEEEFLLEFKTHNTKSFSYLVNTAGENKVEQTKPQHYAQMQIYMHKHGLKKALYAAVNKNDDDLYIEVIEYDPAIGEKLLERARAVIHSRTPPDRLCKSASWTDAKFCDHRPTCFMGEPMVKSCRSCVNIVPIPDGQWQCGLWNAVVPAEYIPAGCDSWKMITD